MSKAIVKTTLGIVHLKSALNLLGARTTQNATNAQTEPSKIMLTSVISPLFEGVICISTAIANNATIKPPNMAQSVLKSPILLPLFSGIFKFCINIFILHPLTSKMLGFHLF